VSDDAAVHDIEIGELPPAVSQFCFWFVSVCTLTPELVVVFVMVVVLVSANAKCTALPVNTAAIAEIEANAINVL
jgi:hypothetical protein